MQIANFTKHAETRLGERSKLSPDKLRLLLDNGYSTLVAVREKGRYAMRLVFSIEDRNWFVVVQDAGDAGILTVLPWEYQKKRLSITGDHRRNARRRARAFERACERMILRLPTDPSDSAALAEKAAASKIFVSYVHNGSTCVKQLAVTSPRNADPASWNVFGPIHEWLRERIIESGIPFRAILKLSAKVKNRVVSADALLENLRMTPEEIEACR
jgi:hypothetical protein